MSIFGRFHHNFPSKNVFSFGFTCRLTASVQSVFCSLGLLTWASVAIRRGEKITTSSGKGTFYFCDMSHILFGMVAILPRELIFVAFILCKRVVMSMG